LRLVLLDGRSSGLQVVIVLNSQLNGLVESQANSAMSLCRGGLYLGRRRDGRLLRRRCLAATPRRRSSGKTSQE